MKEIKMSGNVEKTDGKLPPHSIEAEQCVLGGLLLDDSEWKKIDSIVDAREFYDRKHTYIFTAMRWVTEAGKRINVDSVIEKLREDGLLTPAGGENYIIELRENTQTAANVTAYAQIVRERSVLCGLILRARNFTERAEGKKEAPAWGNVSTDPEAANKIKDGVLKLKAAFYRKKGQE